MTEHIELDKARYIAEIGAGTGAFTRSILQKKNQAANFFAVEVNEKMANKLSHKIENLDIEVDSAQSLKKDYMQKRYK